MKNKNQKIIFMHIFLIIFILFTLFPVLFIIIASLQIGGSLTSNQIIPTTITLENYIKLFTQTKFLKWLLNSLFISSITSIISVALTVTAGYAFSRFNFIGKKYGIITLILIQMFPAAMAMVALFKLMIWLSQITYGLIGLNTLSGLSLIYIGGSVPFSIWLFKGYIDSIPIDLEEAALLDGASIWQAFYTIILPLIKPIIVVVALFNFIAPYNDFILPSIFMTGEDKYTVAVGLKTFISGQFSTNWSLFAAAALIGALPILIIFLTFQKNLVDGLTKGAVK